MIRKNIMLVVTMGGLPYLRNRVPDINWSDMLNLSETAFAVQFRPPEPEEEEEDRYLYHVGLICLRVSGAEQSTAWLETLGGQFRPSDLLYRVPPSHQVPASPGTQSGETYALFLPSFRSEKDLQDVLDRLRQHFPDFEIGTAFAGTDGVPNWLLWELAQDNCS